MFIKLEPGGLITPLTPQRIRRVGGARSATPVGMEEERPLRTPAEVARRYERISRPDDDPDHAERMRVVQQIMRRAVTTLPPEAHLDEAWRVITAQRFRHIPVVDPDLEHAIVGMLSDRDLLAAAAHLGSGADRSVSEIMATSIIACRPTTPIRTAAEAMLTERIGALPVVSKLNKLIGIVSRSDILRAVVHEVPIELWG